MKTSTPSSPTRRAAIVGSIGAAVLGTAGVAGTLRAPQASADARPGGAVAASAPGAPGAPGAPAAADDTSFTLFEGRQSEEFECFRIPSLVTTPAGTTIAFVEGRRPFAGVDFCYDDGSIDIVMKRSSNGGTDWDPQEVILTGNPWGGTAQATRGNPVPIVLTHGKNAGRIVLLTTWNQAGTREKRIPFVMHSDDDGKTWSEASSLEDQLKGDDIAPVDGWYGTGPQHGIQMVHGEHAGRLAAGVYYEGRKGAIIVSDDDGVTWTQGQGISGPESVAHFGEVGVEETADGSLIAIGRLRDDGEKSTSRSRAVARSTDGGETFETATFEIVKDLETTPGVHGALINRDQHGGDPGDRLLYSAPTDPEERKYMAVFASEDAGHSWAKAFDVPSERAGYSDMTMLDDAVLGLLHEAGDEDGDAKDRIDWRRITLA